MKFIHIAGTNGKGSVAEYISEILMAAGKCCGCFTSPHLISPVERFRVNGKNIAQTDLDALMSEVAQKKLAVNDTLFAAYTAAALLWFDRCGVEYAVMETGLGGRLDPTNIVTPDVVVLTTIGYDHMDILGRSLEQITMEKCGIIKPDVPVVSAQQRIAAARIITAQSKAAKAPLIFAKQIQVTAIDLDGQTFRINDCEYHIKGIGKRQPEDAALAIMAAGQIGLCSQAIREGLERTTLKCRAQYISGDPDMLIDGAHNSASVDALCATMDKLFDDRQKILLFACMNNKDYAVMTRKLAPHFTSVVVTNVDPVRGADALQLYHKFLAHTECIVDNDPGKAYKKAREMAVQSSAMLVVCGSFYLAGKVYELTQKK